MIVFSTGIIITIISWLLEYDENGKNNIKNKIGKILKIPIFILLTISLISFISIDDMGVSDEKISDTTMMIPLTEKNKHNLETEIYYEASKKHYEVSLIVILPPVIVMLMLSFANLTSEGFNEMLDADRNNRKTLTYKEKIQLRNEVYNEINKDKKIPIRNTKIMKEYVNKNMK